MADRLPQLAGPGRAELIRRLVDDTLERRSRGEEISDETLCQENPELLPELAEELRKLRLIEQARLQSQQPTRERAAVLETAAYVPKGQKSPRLSQSLHIRCPLCHEPLDIAADQALDDLHCSACQGRFSLAGDDPELKPKSVSRIAHFELLERLGMGGFGTVWKAHDTELDRAVAIKIPRAGLRSAEEVEEFLHEARVAARLRHPQIVSVHEIGKDGDTFYIVSDLVDGVSLAKHKELRKLTHREAAELLVTVCDALHFAHDTGIVHRDLKPGNILIDGKGQPHITDFGLAKRSREEVEITIQGEILGTPAYMSPEQARGEAHLADCRTDVYAVGVMLFELSTDFLPFRGNIMMLTHHAIHTEPPSLRSLNASVPRDLETICLKCLEKQPSRRYASAKDLADELRRYLAGDAILARPTSRGERLWRWCRKNPRIPALSAALLLVVLLAYALAFSRFLGLWNQWDRKLTDRALGNVAFTAQSVAQTAGNEFEQLYDLVEEAARDVRLRQLLHDLQADDALRPLREQLYDPARHERNDAQTLALREQLKDHAIRKDIQAWVENFGEGLPHWATFVMLADGLQVARFPIEEETIGRNYIWRGYALQRPDEKKDWRPVDPDDHLQHTYLSPPFVSEYSNAWVVVVSTPVTDKQAADEKFLGIVGVMVRLGSFARLPGNVAMDAAAPLSDHSFAVLVDSRHHEYGHILQHPLYGELSDKSDPGETASPRRKLLDRSSGEALGVKPVHWTTNANYVDPFAAEGQRYNQRWLAAKLPVQFRGDDSGLAIIVQESYDQIIGQPLTEMRQGLIFLSLVTLLLSAAVIVPLWVMILRLVR